MGSVVRCIIRRNGLDVGGALWMATGKRARWGFNVGGRLMDLV
jgi:hypothetical protein